MLYAWKTEEHYLRTTFTRDRTLPVEPLVFSLIVPARHEDAVLGHTLDKLASSEHPRLEIICVVGHDDPGTAAVAQAAAARHPNLIRVVTDHSEPKNKPKALNTALEYVRGDVVGVFDAEDDVDPRLLPAIERCFFHDQADVVQGGVQLMNIHSSWWSLRNCLEYFFWFRSRLHFHADSDFIPLGGNTVFVRTALLRNVGGWDPECLAEDCELGVRLSALGAWVSVAYEPELATREETPGTIAQLVRQRTRWDQGFLQVYKKGIWRELSTRRRWLAQLTLLTPFLQAVTGLFIPLSILLMIFGNTPVLVSMIGFVPAMIMVANVTMEILGLYEFGKMYRVKVRLRDYIYLVVGTVPYQWLLAYAAARSVYRELRSERGWEKTAHTGAHRDAPATPLPSAPAPSTSAPSAPAPSPSAPSAPAPAAASAAGPASPPVPPDLVASDTRSPASEPDLPTQARPQPAGRPRRKAKPSAPGAGLRWTGNARDWHAQFLEREEQDQPAADPDPTKLPLPGTNANGQQEHISIDVLQDIILDLRDGAAVYHPEVVLTAENDGQSR
ncbi:MAG: glycosyl transferase [Micrococcales bacterium]|nr:MAG: glycosyl transferase [Micrococcales bacterium]